MKLSKFILKSAVLAMIMMVHSNGQVVVTGFGTGDFTASSTGSLTGTQTATTYEISGLDGSSAQLFGNLASSAIVGIPVSLQLTASYSSLSSSTANFQMELFDLNGNGYIYQGNLNSFSPRGSNVSIFLSSVGQDSGNIGNFNGTVTGIQLSLAGLGSGSLDLTMDQLTTSSVPEPATYALLVMGGLVIFGSARALRKAKIQA